MTSQWEDYMPGVHSGVLREHRGLQDLWRASLMVVVTRKGHHNDEHVPHGQKGRVTKSTKVCPRAQTKRKGHHTDKFVPHGSATNRLYLKKRSLQ